TSFSSWKTLCVVFYVSLECAGFLHGLGYDVTVMVRFILLIKTWQNESEHICKKLEIENAVPTRIEEIEPKTKTKAGRIRVHFAIKVCVDTSYNLFTNEVDCGQFGINMPIPFFYPCSTPPGHVVRSEET
ncbi:hypothetical protein OSTOST_15556, partial [Ostertagia ostertagi]